MGLRDFLGFGFFGSQESSRRHEADEGRGTGLRGKDAEVERRTRVNGGEISSKAVPEFQVTGDGDDGEDEEEEQTTPKAKAFDSTTLPPVPSFTLSDGDLNSTASSPSAMAPPPVPTFTKTQPKAANQSSSMMPPPAPSSSISPPAGRLPSLAQFPAPNSAQRARGPAPNRGPPSSLSAGLAPPPTHSAKPSKPNRKVLLTPGHSPLDWARISGPNADLRGVEASTPYLRVTPSMLKKMTGRKGKDAWMALNGKVYNVTPYADFHPGGVPELMRGAGRDGTRLFGEVHPWVNYETMLSACLVGLLVEEEEGTQNQMDQMD